MTSDSKLISAVTELVKCVSNLWGLTGWGERIKIWLCGKTMSGHTYRVSLLAADDDDVFVMDPLTECRVCGKPMDADQYSKMVAGYLALRAAELAEEDEVW